jgi:L-alanine-DL-glutamate epimerase-like enolase superfamily enzyme
MRFPGVHSGRVDLVRLPMRPLINAGTANEISSLGLVLVTLQGQSGAVGEGMAYTINGVGQTAVGSAVREIVDVLTGTTSKADIALEQHMRSFVGFYGSESGVALSAHAAVEEALWDVTARTENVSIAEQIGAEPRPLPVYASGGFWVDRPLDDLCEAAADVVDQGFSALKLRLGSDMAANVERVRRVRETVGASTKLLVDSNQRWTREEAVRMAQLIAEFEIAWFEEPVDHRDHAGESFVRRWIPMPLATGETVWGRSGVTGVLLHDAADVVMPDLQRMGGPRTMLDVCREMGEREQAISSHLSHEMNVSLLAGLPNAICLEHLPWFEPIYRERLQLDEDGNAVLPQGPGWGFTFDPQAVEQFRIGG